MSATTGRRTSLRRMRLRDPISKMQVWLLREGILIAEEINALERGVDEEVQRRRTGRWKLRFRRSTRS